MRRRHTLVSLLWLGIAPFSSFAQQQTKVWRVGFLASSARPASANSVFERFRQGMRELDYIEGKNLVIEARFAEGSYERLPGLAAEPDPTLPGPLHWPDSFPSHHCGGARD